jgi:hypothetical protein
VLHAGRDGNGYRSISEPFNNPAFKMAVAAKFDVAAFNCPKTKDHLIRNPRVCLEALAWVSFKVRSRAACGRVLGALSSTTNP